MNEEKIRELTEKVGRKISKKLIKEVSILEFPTSRCVAMNILNILSATQAILMSKELQIDIEEFTEMAVINPIKKHVLLYKNEVNK